MKKEIVLGVTASIAIYKACDIVRRLQENNCSVTVVMTSEAQELIKPVVFSSLSGKKVYSEMFVDQAAWEVEHVSLAEKADAVLIAPATANVIAKLASGICDDLLTCVVAATKAKVLVSPAMNENMFLHRATQDNLKRLKAFGYTIIEPKKGKLACGATGIGCLADVDEIVRKVVSSL